MEVEGAKRPYHKHQLIWGSNDQSNKYKGSWLIKGSEQKATKLNSSPEVDKALEQEVKLRRSTRIKRPPNKFQCQL